MKLRLISPSPEYQAPITQMMEAWLAVETSDEIVPWSIVKTDYHDFATWTASLSMDNPPEGLVPDTTWFCYDEDREICVGAVNIRHRLNDNLLRNGGHIGDGVLPSERGKGIGTIMVGLALEKCRELGIEKVLMTCDQSNVASAKTILRNGGVLWNEYELNGHMKQRYWIDLKKD